MFLGRAAGVWAPNKVPGCVLWLRASVGVTVDGGGHVTAVADQSGLGNDVVASGSPTVSATAIGGKPALAFTSFPTPSYLYNATKRLFVQNGARTIFAVCRTNGAGAVYSLGGQFFCSGYDPAGAKNVLGIFQYSGVTYVHTDAFR